MFAGVMREYPLYTPYGHEGIVVDCPYDRTMFECILVLSLSYLYVHAGIAVGCSCCRCMFESVLVMRLSTPYGYACFSVDRPCDRTMFESVLVLLSVSASSFLAVCFS